MQFFTRVQALLGKDLNVLDFGAGRGLFQEDDCAYRRNLRTLKGKVKRLVGVDVDSAVLTNKGLDEAIQVKGGEALPFPPSSFDLVVSDWVLEHLDDPVFFAAEMHRVLKPGGWLCARTPNKWGLTALGARLVPNVFHARALRRLQSVRQDKDVFPTRYKLNTMPALNRLFPQKTWNNRSYFWRGEPKYYGGNAALFYITQFWNWVVPPFMATDLFVFIQKR